MRAFPMLAVAISLAAPLALDAQARRQRPARPAAEPTGSYTPAARREIAAAQVQRVARFNAGALNEMAGHYAPDAQLLPPEAPAVRGRGAIMQHWNDRRRLGVRDLRLQTTELQQEGSLATEIGVYAVRTTGGVQERGKYIAIWKRNARGTWEVHREMYSADAPRTATPRTATPHATEAP